MAERGDLQAAKEAFVQALSIRRDIDANSGIALDDLAGMALVALSAGDLTQAVIVAKDALAWIEANGATGIDRIEYPVRVYLICYQVLQAYARERPDELRSAQLTLQQGVALLQRRAVTITDRGLQQQYLKAVSFNGELMAAWTDRAA